MSFIITIRAADIGGVPIAGYVESFIGEHASKNGSDVDVPKELLRYFRQFASLLDGKEIG